MSNKYFIQERETIIQDIESTMKSIVSNLDDLNVYLDNINEIGNDFENVSKLWELFYTGQETDKTAISQAEKSNLTLSKHEISKE